MAVADACPNVLDSLEPVPQVSRRIRNPRTLIDVLISSTNVLINRRETAHRRGTGRKRARANRTSLRACVTSTWGLSRGRDHQRSARRKCCMGRIGSGRRRTTVRGPHCGEESAPLIGGGKKASNDLWVALDLGEREEHIRER